MSMHLNLTCSQYWSIHATDLTARMKNGGESKPMSTNDEEQSGKKNNGEQNEI